MKSKNVFTVFFIMTALALSSFGQTRTINNWVHTVVLPTGTLLDGHPFSGVSTSTCNSAMTECVLQVGFSDGDRPGLVSAAYHFDVTTSNGSVQFANATKLYDISDYDLSVGLSSETFLPDGTWGNCFAPSGPLPGQPSGFYNYKPGQVPTPLLVAGQVLPNIGTVSTCGQITSIGSDLFLDTGWDGDLHAGILKLSQGQFTVAYLEDGGNHPSLGYFSNSVGGKLYGYGTVDNVHSNPAFFDPSTSNFVEYQADQNFPTVSGVQWDIDGVSSNQFRSIDPKGVVGNKGMVTISWSQPTPSPDLLWFSTDLSQAQRLTSGNVPGFSNSKITNNSGVLWDLATNSLVVTSADTNPEIPQDGSEQLSRNIYYGFLSDSQVLTAEKVVEYSDHISGAARDYLRYPQVGSGKVLYVDQYDDASGNLHMDVILAVRQNPFIADGGVVNAVDYTTSFTPGGLIAIFGLQLTPNGIATAVPFNVAGNTFVNSYTDSSGNSVSVYINGKLAPLLYISPGQINAQIPSDIPLGTPVNVQVVSNGLSSNNSQITLTDKHPAVFSTGGMAILVDAFTGQLMTSTNPTKLGGIYSLYGTGFGPTSIMPSTGQPYPFGTLANLLPSPTFLSMLIVDSKGKPLDTTFASVKVLWCGGAPGLIIQQCNIQLVVGAPGDFQPGVISTPDAILEGADGTTSVVFSFPFET